MKEITSINLLLARGRFSRLWIASAILVFSTGAGLAQDESEKLMEDKVLMDARRQWTHFLKSKFKIGDSLENVEKIMHPLVIDWGERSLGGAAVPGAGSYEIVFKLDDFSQAVVTFDFFDKVSEQPRVRYAREEWAKGPGRKILKVLQRKP